MKIFKLFVVFAALVLFVAACGNNANTNQTANVNTSPAATTASPAASTPAAPDELETARVDYARFCIRCHQADGTGGPFELEDGSKLKVPSLREHGRRDPDKHLADQIADGGDGMPAFKNRLDEARINALVRYVRREFHGQTATGGTTPATPSH
jgi:cytochrome c551